MFSALVGTTAPDVITPEEQSQDSLDSKKTLANFPYETYIPQKAIESGLPKKRAKKTIKCALCDHKEKQNRLAVLLGFAEAPTDHGEDCPMRIA